MRKMLITKEVEVKLTVRNSSYYEEKGYIIPRYYNENKKRYFLIKDSIINVKLEHLNPHSKDKVEYLCDYCLENGLKTKLSQEYRTFLRFRNKGKANKDCCKKCSPIKQKENHLLEYGVEHQMYRENIKNKVSNRLKRPYEEIEKDFQNKNYTLMTNAEEWMKTGIKHLKYKCNIHEEYGEQVVNLGHFYDRKDNCKCCLSENTSGENSHLWKGGISPLQQYLRKKIDDWRYDSMRDCNFKCVITGENFDIIHHQYSFAKLLEETLKELKYDIYKNINEYSQEQLLNIENRLLEIHYRYPLGVCLKENLHKLYHSLYGEGNNLPIEFEEFKTRLRLGEFNNFLEENNLKLII
jgi:hypothetical protein